LADTLDEITTRRFFRYHTHTPVCIAVPGSSGMLVPGLVSKLSRSGMEVYAGVNLEPGDVMEVEFRTDVGTIHIAGIVRNRSGFCFGIEFSDLHVDLKRPRGRR